MKQVFKQLLLLFYCITLSYADNPLQNPSFDNVTTGASGGAAPRFSVLNRTNSNIPGWSFAGTVYYVSPSDNNNSTFITTGRQAIQLAKNGKINQTLVAKDTNDNVLDYVISFNLAMLSSSSDGCVDYRNRTAALNVTVYHTTVVEGSKDLRSERSKVLFYHGSNFSRRSWETNAFYLGQLGAGDSADIEIKSVSTIDNSTGDDNVAHDCWPSVEGFTVGRYRLRRWGPENFLANGDFEMGPSFLKNSYEGILLNPQEERFNSPLQDWSILGTIRYIDSTHYKVPRGKAVVELLSGDPSGIQVDLSLPPTLTSYTLNFTMGDANDSCVGDFVLYIETGQVVHNFTMRSYGRGSWFRHSVAFGVEPSSTSMSGPFRMSFYVYNETRTSDGVLCGLVLDNIVLVGSYGEREAYCRGFVFCLLLAYLIILI